MKSLLQKQYIGVSIASVIMLGALVVLVVLFIVMKQRQARVHEVKETLATYEQNKKIFAKETATVDFLTTRIVSLESKKITEGSIPQLLSSIETIAEQKGVSITITSVQTPTIDGEEKLFLDIAIDGSFDASMMFTEALRSQEYQIKFSTFALHQEKSSTESQDLSWNVLATFEVISF